MAGKPKFLIPVLVVIGFAAAGYFVDRQRRANRSLLSGVFESQPTTVASRAGGRVKAISVREGDAVQKGQVLVTLEAETDVDQANASKALANQATAKANEVLKGPRQEDILRQQHVVAEARAQLAKAQHGPLPEEIAAAGSKVSEARARFILAQRGARPEDRRRSAATEAEALARYRAAQRGLTEDEKNQLKARLDGASAEARRAKDDAERKKKLYDSGVISLADYRNFETVSQTAEARRADAQSAYEHALKGTPPEELESARQAYEAARAANLAVQRGSRPEDIEIARAGLSAAQDQLRLLRNGTRREDLDAARARLAQAETALATLKHGSRPEEIAQANSAAQAAKLQAASASSRVAESKVASPIDGIVERIPVSRGDLIAAGAPLLRMSDPSDLWLRVYVPETALGQIKAGALAEILVDGLDQPLEGLVESVASQGEFTPANIQTPEERGKQVFAVRVRLREGETRVKAGMAATVKRLGDYVP